MSTSWILYKLPDFARDFLRDFCLSSDILEKEFLYVDNGEHVHLAVVRPLIGTAMSKGMLWRLHDTSRYFFQNDPNASPLGELLEWCVTYLVHETRKLLESAYQIDKCTAGFIALQGGNLSESIQNRLTALPPLIEQAREDMRLESNRIRFILRQCRTMIPLYFANHSQNAMLASFLVERDDLVKRVFKHDYQALVDGIYGVDKNELMYILAASSLRQGGWLNEARLALEKAAAINESSPELAEERRLLAEASWDE